MSETKLKPCPFCGGEAKYDPFVVKTPYSTKLVDAVVCQCGGMGIGLNRADAIETWNRRANDEADC